MATPRGPRRPVHPLRVGRQRRAPAARAAEPSADRGLDALLADLDADAVPVAADAVPGALSGAGFAWSPEDAADRRWWPQGVASLRGGRVLLVTWYERPPGRRRVPRSRVSVVDASDPARPRYRHAELVVPHRRPLGWVRAAGAVPVHAGGAAVVEAPGEGPLLLVADTLLGLRAFRLSDLVRLPASGGAGGRWVLPQRRAVRVPLLRGLLAGALADLRAGRRPDPLRYSFTGVGEVDGEPSLLAGEYRTARACTPDGPPRLVRYRLDPATGLPAGGALDVHVGQPPRMQGVAVLPGDAGGAEGSSGGGPTWYLSASAGHDRCGDLHVGAPGAWRTVRGALPPGCEDLDPAGPAGPLWCATEHPGRRWVFPVDVAALTTSAEVGGTS